MNVQETQILQNEEQSEKRNRGNSWFVMLLGLLSIPLIILGIGLLIFASSHLPESRFSDTYYIVTRSGI